MDGHPDAPDGFLLQVTKAGSRAYRLNYRRQSDNRERRLTIGDVAEYPIAQARDQAAELRRAIRDGRDPLGEREERHAAPTVADLGTRYIKEELPGLAPGTQASYRSLIERRILPALGSRKVADLSRDDVVRLHRAVTDERNAVTGKAKQRGANATKGMLSVLLNKAVEWGWCDDNPTRFVKSHREPGRERYLSPEEIGRVFDQLDRWQEKHPDAGRCDPAGAPDRRQAR